MNKKYLFAILGIVAVVAVGATVAFFTDTETSTGNSFTAGTIDLTVVDTDQFYNGEVDNSWETGLFFDFDDLKPGDWGSDIVRVGIESNPAWICSNVAITEMDENVAVDPEIKAGDDEDDTSDLYDGELQDYLTFRLFTDNCEGGERTEIANGTIAELLLAHGTGYNISDNLGVNPVGTYCFYKEWCFGVWDGDFCDGSGTNNLSQSDTVKGDISFFAIQSRHNDNFDCTTVDWSPVNPI